MDCHLIRALLSQKCSVDSNERLKVNPQQIRAYLHVVNSIITKREANYVLAREIKGECDDGGENGMSDLARDVEELACCLNAIPDKNVGLYPDAARRIMHILAFSNQRVIRRHLDEDKHSLFKFLRRNDVQALVNGTIRANSTASDGLSTSQVITSSKPSKKNFNETDWMAIACLVRLKSLDNLSFSSVIDAAANALASILEMTPSVWDVEIDLGIRLKVESVIYVLNYITSIEEKMTSNRKLQHAGSDNTSSGVYNIYSMQMQSAGCISMLRTMSIRLESGATSDAAGDNEYDVLSDEEGAHITTDIIHTTDIIQGNKAEDSLLHDMTTSSRLRMIRKHRRTERRMPGYRSQWCDLCMTAVVKLCVKVQTSIHAAESVTVDRNVSPTPISGGGVSTASTEITAQPLLVKEAVGMLVSPCWQRRILSLSALKQSLLGPVSVTSVANSGNISNNGKRSNGVTLPSSSPATNGSTSQVEGMKQKKGERIVRDSKSTTTSTTIKQNRSNNDNSRKLNTNSSKVTAAAATRRSKIDRPVEEICKGGHIRSLCWNLLHEKNEIRNEASNVLQLVLEATERDQAGLDVWAAFVEQGLVILLELIQNGVHIRCSRPPPVQSNSDGIPLSTLLFPEHNIRNIAKKVLIELCIQLENSAMLRLRLSSALIHSGNHTLRNNIFYGLLYCVGKTTTIGKSLWCLTAGIPGGNDIILSEIDNLNGQVFYEMIQVLARDPIELKPIVSAIAHIIKISTNIRAYRAAAVESAAAAFAAKDGNNTALSHNITNRLHGGTTVLVEDNGQLVKMLCPASTAISQHSPDLSVYLDNIASQPPNDITGETKLAVLAGDYGLWQDIFSHMLDDGYILEQSLTRMPADKIIDAYHIARKFRMHILLEKYSIALLKRINGDTIIPIFEAALGRDKDSLEEISDDVRKAMITSGALTHLPEPAPKSNYQIGGHINAPSSPNITAVVGVNNITTTTTIGRKIHVRLTSQCLDYMEKHIENVFSKRRPVRQSELLTLVHDLLGVIFYE